VGSHTQINILICRDRATLKFPANFGGDMTTDESERTSVRTYVPVYQKEQWQSHAEDLGMSQSEFVRTMVQAGRSGFEPVDSAVSTDSDDERGSERPRTPDATPRGQSLEDSVVEVLADGAHYDWDELVAALPDDIEERLDETLQELQSASRVRYSGRHGGYVLDE